ncbi:hypothetical protein GWK47_035877 [Chionoecetes opilio]|uniref:Uncharacterized protein n=1 Tax=Chionoecetes opilio TaxID=41210 RepID=A0A8J4YMX0_CHIOP|nr:hypothetical protein GWK47_035877 [Chionoecetes opilio]
MIPLLRTPAQIETPPPTCRLLLAALHPSPFPHSSTPTPARSYQLLPFPWTNSRMFGKGALALGTATSTL